MNRLQLFALAALAVWAFSLHSLYAQWQPTNGPFHHQVSSLLTLESAVLAGTNTGVYISTDNGQNWTCTLPVKSERISFHTDQSVLYAYTFKGAFRSEDGGFTWNPAGFSLPLMVVHNHRLFTVANAFRLQFSDDGGTTWTEVQRGSASNKRVFAIATDGSNLIMVVERTGTTGNNIYRSTDNGVTWLLLNVGGEFVHYVNSTFYVSTPGTIFRSTDGGVTWSQSSVGVPAQAYAISIIHHNDSLFAAMHGYSNPVPAGIYTSADNGMTWKLYKEHSPRITCLGVIDSKIAAGSTSGQLLLFESGNPNATPLQKGFTSTSIVNHLYATDNILYAMAGYDKVLYSLSAGETEWRSGITFPRSVATLGVHNNRIFAGMHQDTIGSVLMFSDDAVHWHEPDINILSSSISGITSQGDVLIAGSSRFGKGGERVAGAWFSTDNGVTWTASNVLASVGHMTPHNGEVIAVADSIYYSNDGKQWSSINGAPFPLFNWTALASNGRALFFGQTPNHPLSLPAILVSTDGGATRIPSTEGLPTNENPWLASLVITDFAVHGNYVFAGGNTGDESGSEKIKPAIFMSADDGKTWKDITGNIGGEKVYELAICDGYLYAGTASAAVWRRALSELTTTSAGEVSQTLHFYSVQPHPLSVASVLQLGDTCELHNATLTIAALDGKHVRTVHNLYGTSVLVERGDMVTGIYMFTLSEEGRIVASGTIAVE